jgi:uncharacterized protein with GYD domain
VAARGYAPDRARNGHDWLQGEFVMAKFLAIASYTTDGLKELAAHGASARIEASKKLVAEAGGSIESFYYAFGSDDVFIVCDMPDNITAAATAIAAGGSGVVVTRMVPLLTADEIDQAAAKNLQMTSHGR